MTLVITKESKNDITLVNEGKVSLDQTWDDADFTWDDAGKSTWDLQRIVINKESKNNITLSNEAKN